MPWAPNTTLQAQCLLLKKLGIHVSENVPKLDIEAKIWSAFQANNLSMNKKRCLDMLLNGGLDMASMDLDLDGLEIDLA
jgi:hypothetical protein